MLIINDRFSVERDARNWCLVDTKWSTISKGPREGERTMTRSVSYYGNLESLCMRCVDKSLDPTGGFNGMRKQLEVVKADLHRMVQKHDLEIRRTIKDVAE